MASIRTAVADRRGATAALFGVTATVVVGFAGLATEAGYWYNVRRDAQNAADTAAYAGAVRLGFATNILEAADGAKLTQIQNTGRDTTSRNGFTHGSDNNTVDVNWPPASGAFAGNAGAVEVIVTQQRPRLMSALFMPGATQQIQVRGVAALQNLGNPCILALTAGLVIGGNTTVLAPNCLIASNQIDNRSINFNGASRTIDAGYLVTAGGCDGCDAAVRPDGSAIPYATYGTGVHNPFEWADSATLPALSCTGPNKNTEGPILVGTLTGTLADGTSASSDYYVICKDWRIESNTTTTLPGPGTYFFYGADLDVQGTLNWTCAGATGCDTTTLGGPGVTLAFVQDNSGHVGTFSANSQSILDLKAPAVGYGLYPGLVIYRQAGTNKLKNGVVNNGVVINGGNTATRLAGAVYAPSSEVRFNGNADIALTGCLQIVGGSVVLEGNATTRAGNCKHLNPNMVTQVQMARLVE